MSKLGYLALMMVVGCGVDSLELGEHQSALTKCPDPDNCTVSNGGGTYTEEFGFAGIGANDFMITRFVNHTSSPVTLQGRYHKSTGYWGPSTGTIDRAIYNGNDYTAVSVYESGTTPTWVLSDGTNTVNVVGADIENMQLRVHLDDETTVKFYTLQFSAYKPETMTATIRKVNMMWNAYGGPSGFTQYCNRADGSPDSVVFQQGIYVNAINANVVTRNDAYVTLSCRYGAPATVRLWGYTYRVGNTDLFDAALHMKRASYCGDDSFYTSANTDIYINDSQLIHNDYPMTPSNVEAVWDTNGAVCVNMGNRRHKGALYDGVQFHLSDCGLSDCATLGYLQDRPLVVQQ